jgi:SulP family sulfate permease
VFRADLVAGLTVAAVAVPQAMAYASIFGVPVEYGLYTAIVMTAVGALLDSSKQLINGPTNAISIALLSALAAVPAGKQMEAAVVMALLVGVFQTGITLLRLGDLSRFVSHAVIVGFTLGAGVLLVLDQIKHLIGFRAMGDPHDHFLARFFFSLRDGRPPDDHTMLWTSLLGGGTIVLVLALRWVNARRRWRLPEFLIAVIAAAAAVWALDLARSPANPAGVAVIGDIPRKLPSFRAPQLTWEATRQFSGSALAIALLGLLEAIAMAKAIAAHTGQKLDINQQCLSEGLANLSGSFFQCFPGSGSLTRSAINHQAGAATQWSGVISAAAVAATILAFAPLAWYIPKAALAGILMVSAFRMVDRAQLVYHIRTTRFDAGIVLATAASAVLISVEFCIMIGVFLSFVFYVPRAARVLATELTVTPERVIRERVRSDPECSRLLIYNIEGELFFGSAPDLEDGLARIDARARKGVRVVVLRLKRSRNPDAVCLSLLERFLDRMSAAGVTVLLCGVRHDMFKVLRNVGLETRLGENRIFREVPSAWSSTLEAVRHAYELLAGDVCDTCPRRQGQPGRPEDWYYMI